MALYHMALKIFVNIGSGNDLVHDGTKPLPELMLTYHQWGPMAFIYMTRILQKKHYTDTSHLLPVSPSHQQSSYWLYKMKASLFWMQKEFSFLHHLSVEKW